MNRQEQFELVLQLVNLRRTPRWKWVLLGFFFALIVVFWVVVLSWKP